MPEVMVIRVAEPEDAAAIQAIYAPVVINTAISFEEVVPSVEEMRERITTTLQTYPYLVAVQKGRVVGYAYASLHRARAAYRWAVDVTVYVGEGHRRSGIGRHLYDVLLPVLKRLGYRSAYAGIALPNEGSVGLHERLGFQHIGTFPQVGFKLDAWHDVGYWRFDLGGDGLHPEDPTCFQAIC